MKKQNSSFRKCQLLVATEVSKAVNIKVFQDIIGQTHLYYLLVYILGLLILERKQNMTNIARLLRSCFHDSLYRMLRNMNLPLKVLMSFFVGWIQAVRRNPGHLILDDSVIAKRFAKVIAYAGWAWSSSEAKVLFGIHLVLLFWTDGKWRIPVGFRLWRPKSATRHYRTKLELARLLLCDNADFCQSCSYLAFDSWYCSKKFLRCVRDLKLQCVSRLPRNRNVIFNKRKMKVSDFGESGDTVVELPGFGPVLLCSTVVDSQMNYLISTQLDITGKEVIRRYRSRWPIEEHFRVLKQCLGLGHCQSRMNTAVVNHITSVFLAYLVLEILSKRWGLNHYDTKLRLQDQFWGRDTTRPALKERKKFLQNAVT